MVVVQIRRRSVHAVVEAIQEKRSGGEGASEVSRAGARNNRGGRDSSEKVIAVRLVATYNPCRRIISEMTHPTFP